METKKKIKEARVQRPDDLHSNDRPKYIFIIYIYIYIAARQTLSLSLSLLRKPVSQPTDPATTRLTSSFYPACQTTAAAAAVEIWQARSGIRPCIYICVYLCVCSNIYVHIAIA